uniref:Uncharacterized protein n=1 Tax=Glossina brevipalpis TaxID=37001 RepID=A0A1A9WQM0_9MUSC
MDLESSKSGSDINNYNAFNLIVSQSQFEEQNLFCEQLTYNDNIDEDNNRRFSKSLVCRFFHDNDPMTFKTIVNARLFVYYISLISLTEARAHYVRWYSGILYLTFDLCYSSNNDNNDNMFLQLCVTVHVCVVIILYYNTTYSLGIVENVIDNLQLEINLIYKYESLLWKKKYYEDANNHQ